MSGSVPKLNQVFWSIDPMLVKPWKGVVTRIYESTTTHIRLSPIDPDTGKPDLRSDASALVLKSGLYSEQLDAWIAYEQRLESLRNRVHADLSQLDNDLEKTSEVIAQFMRHENRICHMSVNPHDGKLRTRYCERP